MLKVNVHVILRLVAGAAVAVAFALSPQLAQAQAPGSLTQLGDPNSCIEVSDPLGCTDNAEGLEGTQDVAVTPDGHNVYAIGSDDDAIAEFTRNPDGSLAYIGCIADESSDGTCAPTTGVVGLVDPQAIVISPDGQNVYVAAEDREDEEDIGTIAEFARNPGGTLTQLSPNDCIAENTSETDGTHSDCDNQSGHGIRRPDALAISPDGQNLYAGDPDGDDIAEFARNGNGSLTQLNGSNDCIADSNAGNTDCSATAGSGISDVSGVVVSPDGDNVYTAGVSDDGNASIAEFTRDPDGSLSELGCLGTPDDDESCGAATGVVGITGLAVSPDGNNVYTASEEEGGPIAEFSRGAGGALTQLASPNNCMQEQNEDEDFGCGTTGVGIGDGYDLAVSPDGADVYAAAPDSPCFSEDGCSDVAEFARDDSTGALTQLSTPDSCIQESDDEDECPNENGVGLGGPALAISPDGANVYVTGADDIAEFTRAPVQYTLTASLAGSGSGSVSDGTPAISCPSTSCSHAYTANGQVTLTASPSPGSTFTGWSGACAGTGACQVTMSSDLAVTATFVSGATPALPSPVVTGAPAAVTDSGAGLTGSVDPDGLPTTAYFQYGLDKRYSQVGASGANYTQQTPAQLVGSDFSSHPVGPVTVSGLVPNALYHVRLVATNADGTTFGQDVTFTTATSPAPGPPILGQTFNIAPVSGLVLIDINGQLIPLTELRQIGPGAILDTLQGTLELITSTGGSLGARDAAAKGKTQSGQFGGAVFRIHQALGRADRGLTTVMMLESAFKGAPGQAICRNNGSAADATVATTNSRVIQLLHASAHGKFRTSGRYSAATVLGTIWTVSARCDGTLTHAIKDEVVVTDFIRHKSIVLHAGQSYLAPGP